MARIKIDYAKCTGCRHCEAACSLSHIEGIVNPKRSRIRVFSKGDAFYPVIAGPFTDAKCTSKVTVTVEGREFDECMLCRASCPIKPVFKEPDSGIPLKCDQCGEPADPQCVKWCASGALTLIEE
ncbi:MAG: hypothetical protein PHV74_06350 [Dehalococcoidia bacterium]|nr:hypothetical protein [Dehalococcoidia bacterium]